MNFRTFLAILLILMLIPAAMAAYNAYRHSSFTIGDGKDLDLFGNLLGNGSIKDVTCSGNCTGYGYVTNTSNLQDIINASSQSDIIVLKCGIYIVPEIFLKNDVSLEGESSGCVYIRPDGDHNILTIEPTAQNPYTWFRTVKNLILEDISGNQTSSTLAGIHINNSINNPVWRLNLETITINTTQNGITTENVLPNGIACGSVIHSRFHNIFINNPKAYGILLYNVFDSQFNKITIDSATTLVNSTAAIRILNSTLSGSYMSEVKVLGRKTGGYYSGFGMYFENISVWTFQDLFMDTTSNIAYLFVGPLDAINIYNIAAHNAGNHGYYFQTTTPGNISIVGMYSHLNDGYSIFSDNPDLALKQIIGGHFWENSLANTNNNNMNALILKDIVNNNPFSWGNKATAPVAYGAGDTYYNSSINAMCLYTTSWVFIGNSTGVC